MKAHLHSHKSKYENVNLTKNSKSNYLIKNVSCPTHPFRPRGGRSSWKPFVTYPHSLFHLDESAPRVCMKLYRKYLHDFMISSSRS